MWRYFTEKEIKIMLSLIELFFRFIILGLIYLGSLIFEDLSRSTATSVMKLFSVLVNNFLIITNVAKTSILGVAEGYRSTSVN